MTGSFKHRAPELPGCRSDDWSPICRIPNAPGKAGELRPNAGTESGEGVVGCCAACLCAPEPLVRFGQSSAVQRKDR